MLEGLELIDKVKRYWQIVLFCKVWLFLNTIVSYCLYIANTTNVIKFAGISFSYMCFTILFFLGVPHLTLTVWIYCIPWVYMKPLDAYIIPLVITCVIRIYKSGGSTITLGIKSCLSIVDCQTHEIHNIHTQLVRKGVWLPFR